MKFSDWLDAEKGRAKAVADHFDVTASAVTQWREGVPRERMRPLHALTGGAVSYEEMLPEKVRAEAKAGVA